MEYDLSRYGVAIIHRGPIQIGWAPAAQICRPTLASYIHADLAKKHGGTTINDVAGLTNDMNLNRVGAYGLAEKNTPSAALYCLPVSWNEFVMMRDLRTVKRPLPALEDFRVLAVTCLVATRDERFILAGRSQKVATSRGTLSVSAAGYVDFIPDAKELLSSTMRKELEEEVGMVPLHFTSLAQLGVCVHPSQNPVWCEVAHLAHTPLSASEVIEWAAIAKDSWEGKAEAFTPDKVAEAMATRTMHPPAAANIALAFEELGLKLTP